MVDSRFFKNNGPFTLAEVANICGGELVNIANADLVVENIANMETANKKDICFFYNRKAKVKAGEIKASACVTSADMVEFVNKETAIIICNNPKVAALQLNKAFYSEYVQAPSISATAKIHPSAKIGEGCFIGDFVVIGENVEIGNNCRIEPNVVINRGCILGDNCRIGSSAYVSYCIMGNDCYIYSGARIGCDGFGFETIQGQHIRIPQLGKVIIGNSVEVGANSCVDRGALDDTVIGDGCKIDNAVMIAHGVKIGRGCILVSQVGVAGSSTLGDYVVLAGQVGVADHINIGSGTQVGAQSGVMRNVAAGGVVMGSPTVPLKDYMRQTSFLQKNSRK